METVIKQWETNQLLDNFYLAQIQTRRPGTTSVRFFIVTVNDQYRKPEFKIKRRG